MCAFLVRFGLIWYILSLGFVCFDFRGLLREEEFEVGCVCVPQNDKRTLPKLRVLSFLSDLTACCKHLFDLSATEIAIPLQLPGLGSSLSWLDS